MFAPPFTRTFVTGAAGLAAVLTLATALPAQAHVSVTPSTTAAGAYSVLTFSVGHGCNGSATTSLTFKIPEALVTVTPTVNPNWTIEKKMETLPSPVDDGHGGEYTERVDQVVYRARTPLADGYRDTVALSLKLPETPDATLVFPVIQTCEQGRTNWTQTVAEGQPEPESPAPFLTLTEAEPAAGHGNTDEVVPAEKYGTAAEAADLRGSDRALIWFGVAAGVLGALLGAVSLLRGRRQP